MAVFRPEAQLTLFLRIRTKEIPKTYRKCIPTHKLLQEIGITNAKDGENMLNTRLLCCQIATILVLL